MLQRDEKKIHPTRHNDGKKTDATTEKKIKPYDEKSKLFCDKRQKYLDIRKLNIIAVLSDMENVQVVIFRLELANELSAATMEQKKNHRILSSINLLSKQNELANLGI